MLPQLLLLNLILLKKKKARFIKNHAFSVTLKDYSIFFFASVYRQLGYCARSSSVNESENSGLER